jgi:hypothetical protein
MCDKEINEFTFTVKQFPDEFPFELLTALHLICDNINNFNIMGSFKQKSLIFSADIDGIEIIPHENQAKALKNIVNKIISSPDYGKKILIADIKCGQNKHRSLMKYIGELKNGKIEGYSLESIKLHLINEYVPELTNLPLHPTVEEWLKIRKFVSSFIALRWKPDDILRGWLKDGKEVVDLDIASLTSQGTKIDMIYNYYGKYTEISNIIYAEKQSTSFFIKQIKINMLYNLYDNNILKAMKNAYSIARINEDCDMLKKIGPLLITPINSLSSCKSDLTVISDANKFGLDIYYNRDLINTHIGTIILKLATYYYNDLPEFMFSEINSLRDLYDANKFNEKIDDINKIIKDIVNKNTLDYMKKNNINVKKYYP